MIQPLDPFALKFDSIDLDGSSTASAFEHALALAAPTAAAPELGEPGFYLLNDADGRFVVDRDIGVISLKEAALVEAERGVVHGVRLRVIEASGASYELDLQLRITGLVPQMVGNEEFGFGAAPEIMFAPAVPARRVPDLTPVTRIALATPPRPVVAWENFTALADAGAPASISCCTGAVPYGMLLAAPLPDARVSFAALTLGETTPAPSGRNAVWSI